MSIYNTTQAAASAMSLKFLKACLKRHPSKCTAFDKTCTLTVEIQEHHKYSSVILGPKSQAAKKGD